MSRHLFASTHASARRFAAAAWLLSGLLTVSCSDDDNNDNNNAPAAPSLISFTQAGLYPENMQYDAAGRRFLVSSVTAGNIGQVADDGTYSVFASATNAAGTRFIASSTGVYLDAPRNRVLVASANLTTGAVARLVSFNLSTGQLISDLDLVPARPAGRHFASDMAVDGQGDSYVTDSFAPVIYRVDPQGAVTVLLDNPAFSAPAGAFGLNGIVLHPDGYLLVSKTNDGTLFKIPLSNPAGFTRVATASGLNLTGSDNLLLQDNNTLQSACNTQNRVYRLTTTDNWATTTGSGTFETPGQFPSAVARRTGTDSYVLYSHLDQVTQTPPVAAYGIARVNY